MLDIIWIVGKWVLAVIGLLAAAAFTGLLLDRPIREQIDTNKTSRKL